MKVIDFHAHIFPESIAKKAVDNLEKYYGMPWECNGEVSDILKSMKEGKVEKAVVFSTPTKPQQVINVNDFLIKNSNNPAFICFGSVHPDYESCTEEIRRIKASGLKGFKFHPDFQLFNVDDEKMLKVYEEIGPDYPIIIHAGDPKTDYSSPYRFANLLKLFPKHTFIAAHLGGYGEWDEVKKQLIGKNIYFDTSSSMWRLTPKETEDIIKAHGVDKVLFGTDFPAMSHKNELKKFLKLDFTEDEFEKMLYKNAEKILKI